MPRSVAGSTHYTYCLTHDPSGYFYVGARSCTGPATEDTWYWGSGTFLWDIYRLQGYWLADRAEGRAPPDWSKHVIAECADRAELEASELDLIACVASHPLCINIRGRNGPAIESGGVTRGEWQERRVPIEQYFEARYADERAAQYRRWKQRAQRGRH